MIGRVVRVLAGCWFAMVVACGIQIRPRGSTSPDLGPRQPGAPPQAPTRPDPNPRAGEGGADVREVCRAGTLSRDWVAIDYVESDQCPSAGGERYTGALVVRHDAYRSRAELLVCADQRVPDGWRRQGRVEDPGLQFLCRSSARSQPIAERVMRITKS